MEEKRYPELDEEQGIGMCSEPSGSNALDGYANTIETFNGEVVADTWDPGIGPYDMEELKARIDEAETFIEKAEQGDWSDWVTEAQSRANLYNKYPWLK
ncbi:MAG: hypothetical protein VZR53_18325 [Prevotella sp.]|jgi:hypothetical protein|nr:hypothetical protein [Prevotella sp.]